MLNSLTVAGGDKLRASSVRQRLRGITIEVGHGDKVDRRVLCGQPRAHGADAACSDYGDAE